MLCSNAMQVMSYSNMSIGYNFWKRKKQTNQPHCLIRIYTSAYTFQNKMFTLLWLIYYLMPNKHCYIFNTIHFIQSWLFLVAMNNQRQPKPINKTHMQNSLSRKIYIWTRVHTCNNEFWHKHVIQNTNKPLWCILCFLWYFHKVLCI